MKKFLIILISFSIVVFVFFGSNNMSEKQELLDCNNNNQVCEIVKNNKNKDFGLITGLNNHINLPFYEKSKYNVKYYNNGLNEPWDIEFLPNGKVLITERSGNIKLLNNSFKYKETIKKIEPIILFETGLLGLAVDPNFKENNYIYTYHTFKIDKENIEEPEKTKVLNQVTRWVLIDNKLTKDKIIVNNIPGSSWHSGGRLEFGPYNYLYITTGDAAEPLLSQDDNFLGGKVLKIDRDGNNLEIFSKGLRNPQGLAWLDEVLFISEHGNSRHDEINKAENSGLNFGWGNFYCSKVPDIWRDVELLDNETTDPEICYDSYTMAPSGLAIVDDEFSIWNDNLFIAGLRGKHIQKVSLEESGINNKEIFFVTEKGDRLRDVEYNQGKLYVIGDQTGFWEITPKRSFINFF